MSFRRKAELVLWLVMSGVVPAWANNPPQPDGLLSIILIFPVVILAFRLAGAHLTDKEKKWSVLRGVLLALCVLLTTGGTEISVIPLLILLCFGILRGAQAIRRGTAPRRFVIGTVVILWAVFATLDYLVSLDVTSSRVLMNESSAIGDLRSLSSAEQSFADSSEKDGGPPKAYGSVEELAKAQLAEPSTSVYERHGYQFHVELSQDRKQFVAWAIPLHYVQEASGPWPIPGASLVWTLFRKSEKSSARRSLSVDESGVIRAADLQGRNTATAHEARTWPALQ